MILFPLQIPVLAGADSTAAVADSLKTNIRGAVQNLAENPNEFLRGLGQDAISFGLKVLAALLIYIIGIWLIRKVKSLLTKMFEKKGTEKTLVTFTTSFVSILLTAIVIIVAIGTLGINTTSLAALLAAGGMAIGMALSGTVQNFAGGIMILVFKPFKAGDFIKAQGYEGYVSEVNIVSTKIRTASNETIIIPNGILSNGNIDNFFARPYHRLTWNVDVAYGSDAAKVREVLMEIVANEPLIVDSKAKGAGDPSVVLSALKDSSVEFSLKAWVKSADYWTVYHQINEAIYTTLPGKGIEFPFPQIDVHLSKN